MSTETIEDPNLDVKPIEAAASSRGNLHPGVVATMLPPLAPAAAGALALAIHGWLPNLQPPPLTGGAPLPFWERPYPLLVLGVISLALLVGGGQAAWPGLRRWVRHHTPLWAGAIGLFVLWDVMTLKLNWLKLPYFPGPDQVLASLVSDRAVLLQSASHSLLLLLSGYLIGVCLGLTTGILMGWFPAVRYWWMPLLKIVGPIPATALVPLVMTIWSDSFLSGSALIAFAVWFPVTMLTASGISNVRLSYLDVARTLGAGRLFLIFRIAIPSALPHIFVGLFMGLGSSFLTLIVAESVGVKAGLGWYLRIQQGSMEYGSMYAALIIMALFFSTVMTALFKIRDWVLRWQKGVIRW